MTTIADVLDGLQATLTDPENGIEGITFFRIASGPVPTPAVILADIRVSPQASTDGDSTFRVELALVDEARSDDDVSNLLELLEPASPLSVPAVLEADSTLGGRVGDLVINEIGSLREIIVGGSAYWGGSVELEIFGLPDDD